MSYRPGLRLYRGGKSRPIGGPPLPGYCRRNWLGRSLERLNRFEWCCSANAKGTEMPAKEEPRPTRLHHLMADYYRVEKISLSSADGESSLPSIAPITSTTASVVVHSVASEIVSFATKFVSVASTVEIIIAIAHGLTGKISWTIWRRRRRRGEETRQRTTAIWMRKGKNPIDERS